VHAIAIVDGERIESREFPVPEQGGIRVMLVATAKEGVRGSGPAAPAPSLPAQPGIVVLGRDTRFVVEITDDGPQVFYLLEILNNSTAPVNPATPFVLDLPSDATTPTLMQGSSPQALLKGSRLTVNGPFASGRTMVQVAFTSERDRDAAPGANAAAPLEQLSAIVRKLDSVAMSSPPIARAGRTSPPRPRATSWRPVPAVAAGTPIAIDVTGMPHHSPAPRASPSRWRFSSSPPVSGRASRRRRRRPRWRRAGNAASAARSCSATSCAWSRRRGGQLDQGCTAAPHARVAARARVRRTGSAGWRARQRRPRGVSFDFSVLTLTELDILAGARADAHIVRGAAAAKSPGSSARRCGKSTLLAILATLVTPSSGEVITDRRRPLKPVPASRGASACWGLICFCIRS
jgi:hypothetical protein